MHTLTAYQRPHEEELRHARIGFDILRQNILDCFVPTDLQPARPGTLNGHFWRGDHEEHVHKSTKAGEQTP